MYTFFNEILYKFVIYSSCFHLELNFSCDQQEHACHGNLKEKYFDAYLS
jgi:hypothetical protein